MKRFSTWWLRLVGLGVFCWLLSQAQWHSLQILSARIDIVQLCLVPILSVLMIGVRAWRWNLLLSLQNMEFPLLRSWIYYTIGVFLGSFTPGRIGDMAKAVYLKEELQVSWEKAVAGTLADRLLDVGLILVLGGWAIYYEDLWNLRFAQWGAVVGVSGLFFALLLFSRPLRTSVSRRIKHYRTYHLFMGLKEEMKGFYNWMGVFTIFLTLLAYSVYSVQNILLARALGFSLSAADVIAAVVLIGLAAFLPISIAGLGTREGLLLLILAHKGVPNSLEAALMFSGLFFAFGFVFPAVLGFACWLKYPLSFGKIGKEALGTFTKVGKSTWTAS